MSWSFSKTGPIKEVREAFKEYKSRLHLPDPEKSIVDGVAGVLDKMDKAFSPEFHVTFTGHGSQYSVNGQSVNQTLYINISPVNAPVEPPATE